MSRLKNKRIKYAEKNTLLIIMEFVVCYFEVVIDCLVILQQRFIEADLTIEMAAFLILIQNQFLFSPTYLEILLL